MSNNARRWWPLRPVLVLAVFLVSFSVSAPAQAEEYAAPELGNFIKLIVRYGALDLRQDKSVDLYAKAVECKIYKKYSKDEFAWHRVQKAIRKSVTQNITAFPTGLRYDTELQLGRYDFKNKVYKLTEGSSSENVGSFVFEILDPNPCTDNQMAVIPQKIRARLDQPFSFSGIPMSEEQGKDLLSKLMKSGNADRVIYARFNIKVLSIAPLTAKQVNKENVFFYQNDDLFLVFETRLVSADFFQDPGRTQLIYSYRP